VRRPHFDVMADFRQLALDFVLEDNKLKSVRIAQNAAKGWDF
jgi:hypothetical protein